VEGRGGDFDSDEEKTRGKRTKEQVQAKNRNKHKPRTETKTTPSNQTRRQAGGLTWAIHPIKPYYPPLIIRLV